VGEFDVLVGGGSLRSLSAQAWASTGIRYRVELDSAATADDPSARLARVDEVAEIPRVGRQGTTVQRLG
jgi:hypothetical protein